MEVLDEVYTEALLEDAKKALERLDDMYTKAYYPEAIIVKNSENYYNHCVDEETYYDSDADLDDYDDYCKRYYPRKRSLVKGKVIYRKGENK